MESVTSGGGANATDAYNVNGVRGGANVVTLDGSRLMDVGSNNGVIIAPNNDIVAEVKVQASNYAAEFGSSGIQVSAITKSGSSEFHGTVYDYLRLTKLAANDRSGPIANQRPAGEQVPVPRLQPVAARSSSPERTSTRTATRPSSSSAPSGSTRTSTPGSSLAVVPTLGQRNGDWNDVGGGQHLNQPNNVNIPRGFPGAGTPAPGNNLAPLHRRRWARC